MSHTYPPDLGKEAVVGLVKELFPFTEVDESSVKQLDGYEDKNVYFEGRITGNEGGGRQFVLKIFSLCTSYELAEGIIAVTKYLKGRGFNCPVPVEARNKSDLVLIPEERLSGSSRARRRKKVDFCACILMYIPGEVMNTIQPSPQLLYNVGKHFGNIDTALQAFTHPVIDTREFSDPVFDMKHFLLLKKYLPSIDNPKKRKILETVTTHFKKHVTPALPSLKCGVIHGDAHTNNVIITERKEIAGVIDFGDCINTCYVFELAVLLAGTMRQIHYDPMARDKKDPIQFVCPLISGYLHAFPMSQEELDCLYWLVLARLTLVAVVTEYNYKQQEQLNLYLSKIIDSAWRMAEELLKTPKEEVDRIWGDAIGKTVDDFSLH